MILINRQNVAPEFTKPKGIVLNRNKPLGVSNIKSEMRSFKSNENIHKKEGGSYYVVSANKASSVTL